ncbi:MAG: FmdB family zinc ribbon protein [Anaerolineales bacterium]|jgi:putative FmdB family regulatory protein
MPIYTYRCENCGVQFERQQKFSDAPLKECPECHAKQLRKVYTPVGIVFKGSGFYATDHRSPSGMSSNAKSSSDPDKKPAKEDAKDSAKKASDSGAKNDD